MERRLALDCKVLWGERSRSGEEGLYTYQKRTRSLFRIIKTANDTKREDGCDCYGIGVDGEWTTTDGVG